jgi:hypothetical protein
MGVREDEETVRSALVRFLLGDSSTEQFERWIYDSEALERVLGTTEYAEIAAYDFQGANSVAELRVRLGLLIEHRWPGSLVRTQAVVACNGIIDGSIDVVRGCQILGALAASGVLEIPTDFVAWDDEFDGFPTARQYALWDPEALERKLTFVNAQREDIVRAALEALQRMHASAPAPE